MAFCPCCGDKLFASVDLCRNIHSQCHLANLFPMIYMMPKVITLQAHIVQRGAVGPLIEMLQSLEVKVKEMSAFALGRLAQVIISDICLLSLES